MVGPDRVLERRSEKFLETKQHSFQKCRIFWWFHPRWDRSVSPLGSGTLSFGSFGEPAPARETEPGGIQKGVVCG